MKLRPGFFIIVCWLICLVSAGVAQTGSPTPGPRPAPKPLNEDFKKIRQEYAEALAMIRNNHFAGESLNRDQLVTVSMDHMLQLMDPHSAYLDAKAAEEFKRRLNAQYFGIGAGISELRDGERNIVGTFIRECFRDGPAARAGLRYGDKFVEIDGVSMAGKGPGDVRGHLLGARGTKLTVVIERNGEIHRFALIRDAISQPSIPDAYLMSPGVGYITTNGLARTTHDEFRAALAKLRSQGMRSLILDLRDNSGGLARQACLIVSEFMPRGEVIFNIKARNSSPAAFCTSANDAADKTTPIVVLIGQYTASSAEFLAGGFQDTDRALVVGENTFGKGLLQNVFEFDGGSRIHLTTSRYVTATGRMIQRDYSDESLYRYFRDAGRSPGDDAVKKAPAFTTRTGRVLYGSGGIKPDEVVKPLFVANVRLQWRDRLNSPVIAFTRELVAGRVKQFEAYRLDRPADVEHELKGDEFPVTEQLYVAFKTFATEQYKVPAENIDGERKYVEQRLRTELIIAAYGPRAAQRIANGYDMQLQRAVELVPKARQLAGRSLAAGVQKP